MKGRFAKGFAGALLLAGTMAVGASAIAATTATPAPAAHDQAKAKCEHEAKEKSLKGEKLTEFMKKCEAAPAPAKKAS
jgi:hypothetical protein